MTKHVQSPSPGQFGCWSNCLQDTFARVAFRRSGATPGHVLTPGDDARIQVSLALATKCSCLHKLGEFGFTTGRTAQSTSSAKQNPRTCCEHLAQRRQQQLNFLELLILSRYNYALGMAIAVLGSKGFGMSTELQLLSQSLRLMDKILHYPL